VEKRRDEMRMPGFTAEASLAEKLHYLLAVKPAAEGGKVVPQGLYVNGAGHLIYCYNEGGFSGCIDFGRVGARTLM
jgi:hypothetical protein